MSVFVTIEEKEFQSDEISWLIKLIISVLDTYVRIDIDIGQYTFTNMIIDNQQVLLILEQIME